MKYEVIRTDTADEGIRKIILYAAQNFGNTVTLEKLNQIEKQILELEEEPYIGTEPRYRVLKRQGYRVLVLEKDLFFYKTDEENKKVVMEEQQETAGKRVPVSSEKLKALQAAMDKIEKSYGRGAIMKLGDDSVEEVAVIPTGSIALNAALGVGGYPRGRVIEIYGPESSGKTTLAIHAIAEAQKAGGIAAIIDAEHAFDRFYAEKLGVDVENLWISQPDSGEQALEIADQLIRSSAVDIVVIDSVAALTPKAELEGDMGDSKMGLQARLMSQALRKLTATISKTNTTCIFINQLRDKIGVMFGNPETTTGGNALKFYASVRLDIRRVSQLKDGDEVIGNQTRVKVVKNKVAPPFRKAEFDIMFGQGISREGDVLDLAVNAGIVNKSGAWYAYEGDKIGQGRENAKTYIHENPAFFDMLEAKVRDFYFTQPEDEDAAVQEDSEKPEAEE